MTLCGCPGHYIKKGTDKNKSPGNYIKKGHKRDICPFLPTLHWARIKYCGRTQGGSKVTVVTLCGCSGHYRQKGT